MEKIPGTIEELAIMIYKHMASKEDLKRTEDIQKDVLEELTATHKDVRYLMSGVDILTRNEAERDALVKDVIARVTRLEKKIGLAR